MKFKWRLESSASSSGGLGCFRPIPAENNEKSWVKDVFWNLFEGTENLLRQEEFTRSTSRGKEEKGPDMWALHVGLFWDDCKFQSIRIYMIWMIQQQTWHLTSNIHVWLCVCGALALQCSQAVQSIHFFQMHSLPKLTTCWAIKQASNFKALKSYRPAILKLSALGTTLVKIIEDWSQTLTNVYRIEIKINVFKMNIYMSHYPLEQRCYVI